MKDELLKMMSAADDGISPEAPVTALVKVYQEYKTPSSFVPGDLVMWKDGLRSKNFPEYGKPAVVISVLPEHATSTDAGHLEEFDIMCGCLVNGMFAVFRYESSRLKKWEAAGGITLSDGSIITSG